MQPENTRNHLATETSPYLLQHAGNPVDWHPWGPEALALARQQDKPILLSIGYSACHWCHVMAHESFENADTARLMNELFINIKVDREERPDLDRIYQSAHQLMVGRGGGWPLTMFLTPEQIPFFGGTYFPPTQRHGLPAFPELLQRVAEVYRDRPEALAEQGTAVLAALAQTVPEGAGPAHLGARPLQQAREQLAASYDQRSHGFGKAPKFPHPTNLEFLLRRGALHGDGEATRMALNTLHAMADGGLQDQIGGGFFRYAVDTQWRIPHFEKMLYDNAQLLTLYTDAWQVSGDEQFRRVAEAIGSWALREMQAAEGGFCAAQDADSEGGEGGFYLWDADAVQALLPPAEFRAASLHYGLDEPPNFEGKWHLHMATPLSAVAGILGSPESRTRALLTAARTRLFQERSKRTAPARDDKILTAWNGLMIKGLASAGRRLDRTDFIAAAERAVELIHTKLFRDGRLLASYKDGQARHAAYLDDYAFLLDGLLELLQARWREEDMSLAIALAEAMQEHFEDESNGGFFFTADDHEQLIHRPKPQMDEAIPSGNGIAARALARLGHLLGDLNCLDAAAAAVRAAWPGLEESPHAHASLLVALEEQLNPPDTLVLRGNAADLAPWQAQLSRGYAPATLVIAIPPEARDLPGLLAERPAEPQPVAYLCQGHTCQPAIRTLPTLLQQLAPQ